MTSLPNRTGRADRRVLVLNNYDLARVGAEVARGDKPAHHLFAIDALARAGWDVELIPPDAGPSWLRSLTALLTRARFPVPLGALGQQWHAWRRRHAAAAIYAPCQTQTQTLSYLRRLGALRPPLVTLAHHPLDRGRLAWLRRRLLRAQLRGTDRCPALARGVATEIQALAPKRGPAFSPVVSWGPDLDYYDRFHVAGPGNGVVATGRTGRDWSTFANAAAQSDLPAHVVTLRGNLPPDLDPRLTLTAVDTEADLPYPRLLPLLARARVVAIPLSPDPALAGLTSLTDALGLGKPVIMTRHPLIDLDLEREGIGRFVAPGDVAGWTDALNWFAAHPAEAAAMGRRARALAETRWNYTLFSAEIVALCDAAGRESNSSS